MSVQSTYQTIQAINALVDGIETAPTEMPTSLNAGELPCALAIPGGARWDSHAISLKRQDRTWTVRVYVLPIAQGAGADEGYQATLPILQALGARYLGDLTLGGTVDHIDNLADGGIRGDLMFGGTAYHGFEFTFTVTEKGL